MKNRVNLFGNWIRYDSIDGIPDINVSNIIELRNAERSLDLIYSDSSSSGFEWALNGLALPYWIHQCIAGKCGRSFFFTRNYIRLVSITVRWWWRRRLKFWIFLVIGVQNKEKRLSFCRSIERFDTLYNEAVPVELFSEVKLRIWNDNGYSE